MSPAMRMPAAVVVASLAPAAIAIVAVHVDRRFPEGAPLSSWPFWTGYALLVALPLLVLGLRAIARWLTWQRRLRAELRDARASLGPARADVDDDLDGEVVTLTGVLHAKAPTVSTHDEEGLFDETRRLDASEPELVVGDHRFPLRKPTVAVPQAIHLFERDDDLVATRTLDDGAAVIVRGLLRRIDVPGGRGYRDADERWQLLPDPDRGAIAVAALRTKLRIAPRILLRHWTWPITAALIAVCILARTAASYHTAALLCTDDNCAASGNCTVTTARARLRSLDRMWDPFRCWPTDPAHCAQSTDCREGGYCHYEPYGCYDRVFP